MIRSSEPRALVAAETGPSPSPTLNEDASYTFGDVPLTFVSDDTVWLRYIERRYPRFRSNRRESGFRIRFQTTGPPPTSLVSPLAAHLESVDIEPSASGFISRTETSHAVVDLGARTATLRGPSAMYPLDNLLRHLLPVLWKKGALFHGAALAYGDRGLLACGPSGAGKSTLAELVGENALCDELAGIREEPPGYRLVALPYWASRPGTATLRAVVLLEHGEHHRLDALGPGEALRLLSRQLLWPVSLPGATANALRHLAQLIETTPVLRLAFAPRADIGPFLVKEVL